MIKKILSVLLVIPVLGAFASPDPEDFEKKEQKKASKPIQSAHQTEEANLRESFSIQTQLKLVYPKDKNKGSVFMYFNRIHKNY